MSAINGSKGVSSQGIAPLHEKSTPPVSNKTDVAPASKPEKIGNKGHSLQDTFHEKSKNAEGTKAPEGIQRSLDTNKAGNPYAPKKTVDSDGNLTVEYNKNKEHHVDISEKDGKIIVSNKKNPYDLKASHTEEIDPSKYNTVTVKTGDQSDEITVDKSLSEENSKKLNVDGGDGKNIYTGSAPQNNYEGGKDEDSVFIKSGNSSINTGAGDDGVHALSHGKHVIQTFEGDDTITARGKENIIRSGEGDDKVFVGTKDSKNKVYLSSGNDEVTAAPSDKESIYDGGSGKDKFRVDTNDRVEDYDEKDEKGAVRKKTPSEVEADYEKPKPKKERTVKPGPGYPDIKLPEVHLPQLPDIPDINIPQPVIDVAEKAWERVKKEGGELIDYGIEKVKDKVKEEIDGVIDELLGSDKKKE